MDWAGPGEFVLDGVHYRTDNRASPGTFTLLKSRAMVEVYERLIVEEAPKRILELGIYAGGSTALLAQLAHPSRLAALDISRGPFDALESFLDARDLREVVSLYYGVDQSDLQALDQIVATFDGPLDLIIDDASHQFGLTAASFDHLFPHVRPGGWYVTEDWSWPHRRVAHHDPAYRGVEPLSVLAAQLLFAVAARPEVVTDVRITPDLVLVRRGPRAIRSGPFRLTANFDPISVEMVEQLRSVRSLVEGPDVPAY